MSPEGERAAEVREWLEKAMLDVRGAASTRKYGYPPDKQEKATQLVLAQAEEGAGGLIDGPVGRSTSAELALYRSRVAQRERIYEDIKAELEESHDEQHDQELRDLAERIHGGPRD